MPEQALKIGDTIDFLDDTHTAGPIRGTIVAVYDNVLTVELPGKADTTYREVYEIEQLKLSRDGFTNNWIVDWIIKSQ